jgi:hypothetical protein
VPGDRGRQPAPVDVRRRTVGQMRLANVLCLFVERALDSRPACARRPDAA